MKKNHSTIPTGYIQLLNQIKIDARKAQSRAAQKVNHELVSLYWSIGKSLDERIQKENWGAAVIRTLAKDLQTEFKGSMGFSRSNLYLMVNFYRTTQKNLIVQTLSGQLSWSHISVLLDKFYEQTPQLNYYAQKSVEQGWSVRVLVHQIELKSFERTAKTQNNFNPALSDNLGMSIKDEYVFDFLSLQDEFTERDLEQALLKKINAFLSEMGGVFTYVGNQYRLTVDGDDFFIDVLLFHRRLRCLVAIELKIGEFKPEYAGKMQFYLAALDDLVKQPDEAPSIGIILCKSKKRMIVEYTLKTSAQPMAIATYRLTANLPEELVKELPSQKQMESLFELKDSIFPPVAGKLEKLK
jgi:predicted nuclease of restriction endonuclease-like (RecB) superfamily